MISIKRFTMCDLKIIFILAICLASIIVYAEKEIDYYTCGMHPSVKIKAEDYTEDTLCPICNMKLVPVYKQEAIEEDILYGCVADEKGVCPSCDLAQPGAICKDHVFIIGQIGKDMVCPICGGRLRELSPEETAGLKGVISTVRIPTKQVALAGVKTESAAKHHLFKEIRTVGTVAYDPELAVAQEEFVYALKAQDRIKEGNIEEISRRYEDLIGSSRRKLRLLGMNKDQIDDLSKTRKIQTNLLLPEDEMWVYGDIYEYELGWIKTGEEVFVTSVSFPGEEFKGIVESVNPVINPKTRSVRIRAQVNNPDLKLQPEMYVDIVIKGMYIGPNNEHMVLAIPVDAVLDTGLRKIVWIDKGKGEYEGREIIIGPKAIAEVNGQKKRYYPVIKGVTKGDKVVVKANFLIDSQSQISGTAAAAYGGALEVEDSEKKTMPTGHVH